MLVLRWASNFNKSIFISPIITQCLCSLLTVSIISKRLLEKMSISPLGAEFGLYMTPRIEGFFSDCDITSTNKDSKTCDVKTPMSSRILKFILSLRKEPTPLLSPSSRHRIIISWYSIRDNRVWWSLSIWLMYTPRLGFNKCQVRYVTPFRLERVCFSLCHRQGTNKWNWSSIYFVYDAPKPYKN